MCFVLQRREKLPTRRYASERYGLEVQVTRRSDWRALKRGRTAVSFEISLANRKCTGQHLQAMLEWIGEGWSEIQFSVGDTLHRFNVYANGTRIGNFGASMKVAEEETRILGDEWVEANSYWIDTLPVKTKIIRWNEWRKHSLFCEQKRRFREALATESGFAAAVKNDIFQFNNRRGIANSTEHQISVQSEYILEELAVFSIQAIEGPTINIYPGSPLSSVRYCESASGLCSLKRHSAYVKFSSLA